MERLLGVDRGAFNPSAYCDKQIRGIAIGDMKKATGICVLLFAALFATSQCCLDYNEQFTSIEVINTFYPPLPGTIANSGAASINLSAVPGVDQFGNSYGIVAISAGDLLLIIQMQGASFNFSNSADYGSGVVTSGPDGLGGTGLIALNHVGNYEFVIAQNDVPLSGGELLINGACSNGGLINNYSNETSSEGVFQQTFQVVRVPRYSNLTLTQNLTTTAWNGSVGGVLALSVSGTLDFNGYSILADGKGFRGGYQDVRPSGGNNPVYTTADINLSSGKGEGVCGTPRFLWNGEDAVDYGINWFGYEGGNYGRGAPGNAGGGGNIHNAGGGGGGGYGAGGVGGNYGASAFPHGGRPGSGINFNSSRMIMGGGGGGGDANNALTGIKGGAGGGVVFILAGNVTGSGSVGVSGSGGQFGIFGSAPDGAGGGGAGGTIYFNAEQVSPEAVLTLLSKGGAGGNTLNDAASPHGPGGGGGGGAIFYSIPGASVTASVNAGLSGNINNGLGPPNGALPGQPGIAATINAVINNPVASLTAYPVPAADFISGVTCVNETFSFIDQSIAPGESIIQTWMWDFGDEETSEMSNPDHVYLEPGTYDVRLIIETNFGCRDTVIKQMTIGTQVYDTLFVSVCVDYFWSETNQLYTSSGIYEVNYPTIHGCDSIRVLNLLVYDPALSTTNVSACESYEWNGQTYTSGGTYTYETTSAWGCDSISVLNLTFGENTSSMVSATACNSYFWNGQTYTQSGTYTHLTSNASGCDSTAVLNLTLAQNTSSTTTVAVCDSYSWNGQVYNQSGTYTYQTLSAAGCDSIATLHLSVNQGSASSFTISACESYTWPLNGQSYNQSGTHSEMLINVSGCDSMVTLQLTIQPEHNIILHESICEGQTYSLDGFSYSETGIYVRELTTSSGCDSIVTLNLTVHALPELNNGELYTICSGQTAVLSGPQGVQGSLFWSTGETSTSITVDQSGDYTLTLTTPQGCETSGSVAVLVLPLPEPVMDTDYIFCRGDNLTLDAGNHGSEYAWSDGTTESTLQVSHPGYYTVLITNSSGCQLTAFAHVLEYCDPVIFVPNSFTPDNDGINDYFRAYGENIAEFVMTIFNRWGEPVFQSNDINHGWDGSFLGGNFYTPDLVAPWIIRYKPHPAPAGREVHWRELEGHVVILR